jgi:multimeric flavodoxin WrbA
MKNLVFNGSPRKNGGTVMLIEELEKHLNGEFTVIDSYQSEISPCIDCRYCWTNDRCVIEDEMAKVFSLINEADNIIIASPIYFAELTGQLLSLMSRLQYIWTAKRFRKTEILSPKKRRGALILVDGGAGYTESAMAMGKRLLRIMGTEFIDSVYFSGTDNAGTGDIVIPEHIITEIKHLADKLNIYTQT